MTAQYVTMPVFGFCPVKPVNPYICVMFSCKDFIHISYYIVSGTNDKVSLTSPVTVLFS